MAYKLINGKFIKVDEPERFRSVEAEDVVVDVSLEDATVPVEDIPTEVEPPKKGKPTNK